jgi:hypothetical protein
MKKLILAISVLLIFAAHSFAQEEFVAPQAKLITKFPFVQLTGGIIIIKATIDTLTRDTLNFVLDTGSGGISLDSTTVEEFGFIKARTEKNIRGIAGMKKVDFSYGHYLRFPGLKTDTFSFHINDYELLTSVYGIKIDGIIGYSFLRRYIIKIDYDNQNLEIYNPGSFKYPRGGILLKPNFSSLPLPVFGVEDATAFLTRFIFDTGAGLCFLFNKDFVEDSLLLKKKKKLYTTQAEGLGGKKSMEITVIKSVSIGPYKFRKVPVYIFQDDFNVSSYPQMSSGIIGNDILRRFNVILNYPEQSIHLKPNNRFSDWFDYSYTGLGIYMVNEEITVVDIIKDSPGEIAGFKTGDIIMAIDNNFTKNIQTIKAALQNAGTRLKVLILRNNNPVILTLNVKNILQ